MAQDEDGGDDTYDEYLRRVPSQDEFLSTLVRIAKFKGVRGMWAFEATATS